MGLRWSTLALAFCAALATNAMGSAAEAQQVTLKFHHFLPAAANPPKLGFAPWVERVEKASGGKLKIELFPSMQLGGKPPQLYDQAKDGIIDIAWALAGYTPGRFPRLEVFELPWVSNGLAGKNAGAVWEYVQTFARDELKDVKVLAVWTHGHGHFFTKDKVINGPDDARGLKLRAPNRPLTETLLLIGASPQGLPAPAVPEALSKGVVDGTMFPYEVVPALKIHELTNRVSEFTGDRALYASVFLLVMNKARFDALPADLQTAIDANSGAPLSKLLGASWDEWDQTAKQVVIKQGSLVNLIEGADLAAWKKATEPIIAKWIAERDKGGDKGAELVKAARDLVAKYSQ